MPKAKIPKFVLNPPNKHEKYFEAVLQLRNPTDDLINFINNQLRINSDVFISDIIAERDGYDIYLSSQRFTRALGTKMRRAFKNSEHKTSRRIFTRNRQTSKEVYRVAVFFKILPTYNESENNKTDKTTE